MSWFDRMKSGFKTRIKREIPHGIFRRCERCGHSTYEMALQRSRWICPQCSCHLPIGHRQYIDLVADPGSFVELDAGLASTDPLRFRDTKRYSDRLKAARRDTALNEAICTGIASIGGHPVALGVMDAGFIMGSLGSATGERIVRLIDRAVADARPLILVCQSAGARMMEGAYSLMQMAKVSAKLHELSDAGGLYISVLTDPTYGGVTASYAMLGDVILAEPGARVGFAGQAVIKQFLGSDSLPEGFQLAETVFEHGFIDRIVRRDLLASELARLLGLLGPSAEDSSEPARRP